MSTKYQVIIRNSQLSELDAVAVPQGAGNQGAPVRIKAVAGQRYQLIDSDKAEGMAPDWVRVKRSGKNLQVFFEDSLEPDLVIEDYYEVMPEGYNAVIGQAEVGGLYEYFPEDPDTYGLVPNLVDGAATTTNVVLGGAEIAGFELAGLPLIAAFPWGGVLAAGAVGAAALAGGGGGVTPTPDPEALVLQIAEAQDDGYINIEDSKDGIQARVLTPKGAQVGDMVQVELQSTQQGSTIKLLSPMVMLTAQDIDRGYIDTTINNGNNTNWVNGSYTSIAKLYASNGVELLDSNRIDFVIDTVAPNIGFTLDSITGDDFVAGSEKTSTNLNLTGTATGDFKVGDKVTIIINGKSLDGTIGEGGKVVFNPVKGADLVADSDKVVDFSYTTQDAAGNKTTLEGGRAYLVEGAGVPKDPTKPYDPETNPIDPETKPSDPLNPPNEGVKTALRIDPITGDNIITAAEVVDKTSIPITGVVTGMFAQGDVVTLHVNNKTFTGPVDAEGKFIIDVAVEDLKSDVDTRVDGIIKATLGDTATANQDYQFVPADEPADPGHGDLTALFIDPITDDNIINSVEKTQLIDIEGTVTGKFAAGDEVILTINGKEFKAAVLDTGRFKVTVPGIDLAADPATAVEGKVSGKGGSTAFATQNYGVITDSLHYDDLKLEVRIATDSHDASGKESVQGDGWVNAAELEAQAENRVQEYSEKFISIMTFNKDMMVVGDKLIVTASNTVKNGESVTELKTFILTQQQIQAGFVEVSFNKPGQDNTQTVTVEHRDSFGNPAQGQPPKDQATEDTMAGNIVISVERADQPGVDTTIDPIDFEQAKGVEIKITLPTNVELRAGDVVSLQLRFDNQQNQPRESVKYTLTSNDVEQGFANVLFPPEWFFTSGFTSLSQIPYEVRKGNYWVEAELLDQAGNSSEKEQALFELSQRDAIVPGSSSYLAGSETKSIYLKGADNSETITAGAGNDWIYGGSGTNTLTGGAGSDVFIYNQGSLGAIDTITDFTFGTGPEKDVLMLKDLLVGFNKEPSAITQFFAFEKATDGSLKLKIDHDGEGFKEGAKTPHVSINFSNQQYDSFAYFGPDKTLSSIISQLEQDGNIVV
jgi:hypothetical protein